MKTIFYFVVAIKNGFAVFFYESPPDKHINKVIESGTALVVPTITQSSIVGKNRPVCLGDTVYVNGFMDSENGKCNGIIKDIQPNIKNCIEY